MFKQYVLGKSENKDEMDHRPSVGLFKKPLHIVRAYLQRMLLCLHPFKM